MTPRIPLADLLTTAANNRGVASIAVIEKSGAPTQSFWTPTSDIEPAFLAYSVTKTFMAALVLALCETGQLALDDRLHRWFPHVASAERITLRHLLNHTAGIPDYGGSRAYHAAVARSPSDPWSFERFAAETFDKGLWFEPGEGWAYSNPGYMLVKRILENVSGASFRTLIAERIAGPLGLQRTFVAESLDDLASLAAGTSTLLSPDGTPRDVSAYYHPGWVSHGVIASTASDLACFLDRLFGGALLSKQSLAEMLTLVEVPAERVGTAPGPEGGARRAKPSYGLGLMADPNSPWGLNAGHRGGGPCYSASAFHAFELGGASVCVMGAIEEGFDAAAVGAAVFDGLAGGDRAPAR